ncbi:hypothetical protein F9278_08940 [Streptomyces phaeolivaceus]|uniref:Secreted protein n=1 Tax=Streptomyces phaeolivaceus TaxID=2653200 RepID=A0A5P8JZV8_9ACTN|nr:hypothetical protein [Streptomyces phaeolivaceus]QFQ96306.1 hypothetical protein F9278_08940 [Streptomyces phaeolivaceus]
MRISRSVAPAVVALALVLTVPSESAPHARAETGERHARAKDALHPRVKGDDKPDPDDRPDPFGAACRSTVTGSQVIAHCFNPHATVDHVRLHIECARWWDIDSDSAAVETAPARTVRLTGRCWKEVRSVWFSHRRGAD